MNTLGFTTEYYTLWDVSEPIKKYGRGSTINGIFYGEVYWVQACSYVQNLSKDYTKAVDKIKSMGAYSEDLSLRGHSSFVRKVHSENIQYPFYIFSFGILIGQDIRQCTDIWQLTRTMNEDKHTRRRAIARRRLIDLGELVLNIQFTGEDKYISTTHFRRLKENADKKAASGHFFEAGKRITVNLRRVDGFSFDTQYGTMFIEEYMTEEGQLLKYKGSSPLRMPEGICAVVGTVEHSEYKGQPETRLKRMKLK